ncbi:hypothetical protein [Lactococcus garvieae]|nr:hypothetical protein [Lactococcus garvieae]
MIDKYDLPKEELLTLLVEESKLAPQHQLPGEEIEGGECYHAVFA